ncbi:MAG: hypothetical protein IJ925_05370 [Muribaculaceae bacterium]|nr:hypothetical protein [Muribaculaceae bacterium]
MQMLTPFGAQGGGETLVPHATQLFELRAVGLTTSPPSGTFWPTAITLTTPTSLISLTTLIAPISLTTLIALI